MKNGKGRKGFSLAELLIVVAIIGVLLAIAIPNVIGYARSLKLAELDDSARSIFVAAQNRLTAMKSAGQNLYGLSDTGIEVTLPDHATVQVRAVAKGDAGFDALVPGGSIDPQLHDNHYVVEIDPKTGGVFAVWYWEDDGYAHTYTGGTYNTEDMARDKRLESNTMVGYYGGDKIDRLTFTQMPFPSVKLINAEELRVEITVPDMKLDSSSGYHDDSVLVDVLVNGVEIVKDANLCATGANKITGTVVLDTLVTTTYNDNYNEGSGPDNGALSWTYGMQYKAWKSKISTLPEPGEELTVAVKLHYKGTVKIGGTDTNLIPQTIIVQCNSLFESVEEIKDAAGTGTGHYTANIAYGRHLQNLDTATSGVTNTITGAVQTRRIDFDDNTSVKGVSSWKDTYTTMTAGISTTRKFTAIYNANFTSYDGRSLPISNLDAEKNVSFPEVGLFANIAGTSTSLAELHDIVLIDANVDAAGGSNAGALAGQASNAEIKNCKSYLSEEYYGKVNDDTPRVVTTASTAGAGGLVGLARGTVKFETSFAASVVRGEGQRGCGGLVGNVASSTNLTIEKSYAACYLVGGNLAGGLIGRVESSSSGSISVSNSYAAGIIARASVTAAGISPQIAGSTSIENSYAAVRYGSGVTGRIYGVAPTGAATATAYYVAQNGVAYEVNSGTVVKTSALTGMIGSFGTTGAWSTAAAALADTHAYNQTDETADLGKSEPYPYPMLLSDGETVPHYGDWLEDIINSSAAYVEIYPAATGTGNEYGVYGYLTDRTGGTPNLINTLHTAGQALPVDDCYGLLVPDGEDCPGEIVVDGGTLVPVPATPGATDYVKYDLTLSGTEYDFYRYDFDVDTGSPTADSYYHSVTLNRQEFWFNFDYGCEIVKAPTDGTSMNEPLEKEGTAKYGPSGTSDDYDEVIIRTARQLANMAEATGSVAPDSTVSASGHTYNVVVTDAQKAAQLRAYEQLMNIDCTALTNYTPASLWRRNANAGAGIDQKTGSYNGNGHTISNLHIAPETGADKNVGLFGELGTSGSGTIQGITLVDVTVDGKDCNNVGALAGNVTNSTPIKNCGVYVSAGKYNTCTVTGNTTVGGLVGMLGSNTTIEKSYAAVKVSGEATVGGFVGQINGTKGLSNCYSGGNNSADATPNVNATNGPAGGFAGKIMNCDIKWKTIEDTTGKKIKVINEAEKENCATPANFRGITGVLYSTCSVSGQNGATGFFAGQTVDYDEMIDDPENWEKKAKPTDITFKTREEGTTQTINDGLSNATVFGLGTATSSHAESYSNINLADFLATTDVTATPYDTTNLGTKPFPYFLPAGMEFHGDWPEMAEAVVYWEQENGKYNFYAKALIGDNVYSFDSLCKEHPVINDTSHNITTWGYGTFTTGTSEISLSGTDVNEATDTYASAAQGTFTSNVFGKFGINDVKCKMYEYSTNDQSNRSSTAKPITTESCVDSNMEYNINLYYAAAIDLYKNGESSELGTTTMPYQIRTVRQLDNLPGSDDNDYKQTHDLYADTYSSAIGGYQGSTSFDGTYDGGSYRIYDLSITESSAYVGLFSGLYNDAELKNIILYTTKNDKKIEFTGVSSMLAAGGLVGQTSGNVKISNCVVAGYHISSSNGSAGGLIGYVSGNKPTIENCAAVNELSATTNAGGLVGNAPSGLVVKNSYAGGKITQGASVGGLVGNGSSSGITYENVYSYVNMNGLTATTYGIGPGAGADCYYLETTVNGTPGDSSNPFEDADVLKSNIKGGFADVDHTFPVNSSLTGDYPYPAVVTDHEGKYVHYGDWVA